MWSCDFPEVIYRTTKCYLLGQDLNIHAVWPIKQITGQLLLGHWLFDVSEWWFWSQRPVCWSHGPWKSVNSLSERPAEQTLWLSWPGRCCPQQWGQVPRAGLGQCSSAHLRHAEGPPIRAAGPDYRCESDRGNEYLIYDFNLLPPGLV